MKRWGMGLLVFAFVVATGAVVAAVFMRLEGGDRIAALATLVFLLGGYIVRALLALGEFRVWLHHRRIQATDREWRKRHRRAE